jgi:hypothetical protein
MPKLPVRYIPVTAIPPGVIKLILKPMSEVLVIEFSYYFLKNSELIQKVIENFEANPESDTIFNALPLELRIKTDISIANASKLVFEIDDLLKTNNSNNSYLQLKLPKITLWLLKPQIYLMMTFFKSIVENYDIFKITFLNNQIIENKTKIIEEKIEEQPIIENNIIDSIVTNESNISDILENTFEYLPNNYIKLFMYKILKSNTNYFIEIIVNKDNKIVRLNNLIDETFFEFDYFRNNELYDLVKSIENKDTEEIISIMVNNYKYLMHLISLDIDKSIKTVVINIILFMLFLYRLKITSNFDNVLKYNDIINSTLDVIYKKYIQDNNLFKIEFINNGEVCSNIIEAIEEYDYLLSINRESFINNVSKKIAVKNKIQFPLILSKGFLITLDDKILNNQHFTDFLKIKETEGDKLLFKNISLQITKYYDIIQNIIKSIEEKLFIKDNLSTLVLMQDYIIPATNNNLHIRDLLFLLENIVFPYIYQYKKVKTFIQYF